LTSQKSFLRRQESRLRIFRSIRLLKTSLKQLRPSRFFDAQESRNEIEWRFDTLKHRFIDHQSRFLTREEGRLRFLRAFRLLKTSLKQLRPSRFFDAQESRSEMEWPFDNLKHRSIDFTKVVFEDVQKANYDFAGPFAYVKHHLRDFIQVALFDAQVTKK
jgi:hypothetical protein